MWPVCLALAFCAVRCPALVLALPDGSEIATGASGFDGGVAGFSAPLDLTGVARLEGVFGDVCTGAMLADGRHLVTAGHCAQPYVSSPFLPFNRATFFADGGSFTTAWSEVLVHPDFDPSGGILGGHDVAIILLSEALPEQFARYDLAAVAPEMGESFLLAGFGRSGTGASGDVAYDGELRLGSNHVDAGGDGASLLFFGFDADAGPREAMVSVGDSGGPAFVYDPARGEFVVAAISSGRRRGVGDLDGLLNSSFGETGVAVSAASIAPWIHRETGLAVPEPSWCALCAAALFALSSRKRFPQQKHRNETETTILRRLGRPCRGGPAPRPVGRPYRT